MKRESPLFFPPGALPAEDRAAAAFVARHHGIQAAQCLFAHDSEALRASSGGAAVWHYGHVVLAAAPEEAQRPWAAAREEALLADPRVCAFADALERERLRLLDRETIPRDLHILDHWAYLVRSLQADRKAAHRAACKAHASARRSRKGDARANVARTRAALDAVRQLYQLTLMLRNAAYHAAGRVPR
jgi:hypothetical protein